MIEDARHAHPKVSVRRLCELHGVSRSWFYEQQSREAVEAEQALSQDIEAIVMAFNGYGYRRVTRELARRGHPANHKPGATRDAGTSAVMPPQTLLPGNNGFQSQREAFPESAA